MILAHSWPPDANVGSVRPVYLSRQLSDLGWKPFVLTVQEHYYDHKNPSGIAGSDAAFVVRTRCFQNPRYAYLWFKKLLSWPRRLFTGAPSSKNNNPVRPAPVSENAPASGSLKRTLLSLLYTPDEFLGWFPFAFISSIRLVRRHQIDCVISTGPPFTSHLVAMALKRILGIRWIADFRDPWSWREGLPSEIRSDLSEQINRFLERKVMKRADRIVCVTPRTTDRYRSLYPDLGQDKWSTITNGFDLTDFSSLGIVEKANRFTISYVGTFDFSRSPQLLLEAVSSLIAEGKLQTGSVNIRFVGPCDYAGGQSVADLISRYRLDDVAEIIGFLPRSEAMKEILRAHALLLLGGSQRLSIAAKVYEYVASGNPILAICEDGDTADLIRGINGGRVVAPNDIEATKQAILHLYQQSQLSAESIKKSEPSATDKRNEYNWTSLGMRYASLLESISATK